MPFFSVGASGSLFAPPTARAVRRRLVAARKGEAIISTWCLSAQVTASCSVCSRAITGSRARPSRVQVPRNATVSARALLSDFRVLNQVWRSLRCIPHTHNAGGTSTWLKPPGRVRTHVACTDRAREAIVGKIPREALPDPCMQRHVVRVRKHLVIALSGRCKVECDGGV